jgi:integrase
MTLALNTTMRACEVKGLQWKDVDFLERTVIVRQSKTDAGRRLIPLNGEAFDAIMELYHRAQKVAGTAPDHYVFPACENGKIDPETPQKSWRSAWRSLRKAAGLKDLRFHDLRHQEKMVGERGFEPPTPWSRTRCSTRLSHSPTAQRAATRKTSTRACLLLDRYSDYSIASFDRSPLPRRYIFRATLVAHQLRTLHKLTQYDRPLRSSSLYAAGRAKEPARVY